MSIRLRLALWYSGLLAAVLVAFGLVLYLTMSNHLNDSVDVAVSQTAKHIQASITITSDSASPRGKVTSPPIDEFASHDVYVQIFAKNGELIAASANVGGKWVAADGAVLNRVLRSESVYSTASVRGEHLRIYSTPLLAGQQVVGLIQVSQSLNSVDGTLDRLSIFLFAGIAGAILVTGLSGWALAGSALSPIDGITRTARAIALSGGFSRRLQGLHRKDEVGQLAVTFNEMLASLEAAYSAQRRFVADASHELRTPLTSIRTNLDVLRRAPDAPSADRIEALDDAAKEADRMGRLVADLLALARADAGLDLEMDTINLAELVAEVHRDLKPEYSGVEVSLEHLDDVSVLGDRDRLKQLVLILVDNASKYTPAGGQVKLAVHEENLVAALQVADTGIGIDSEDISQVFNRFFRGKKARRLDQGGTGLGLAIAKWIVEEHGGEIAIESRPGQGSRFTVSLPIIR
ncbi:MAG: HAMP domain-containing histidine kinase [Chloroflexi bacterium]|nr:HAMP domain-containing histidine kinase [Chloroflexota bacterium]